ncbi:unnamed protein product [Paramecium sonneborni]|uniref:Uncharacterized protein n=1 Tax=Paramecium sonneborni TaxID=65129 RepID=A0A8S1LIK5_9CILI|nr:unnamed protein product [Paramecium sonneborni]
MFFEICKIQIQQPYMQIIHKFIADNDKFFFNQEIIYSNFYNHCQSSLNNINDFYQFFANFSPFIPKFRSNHQNQSKWVDQNLIRRLNCNQQLARYMKLPETNLQFTQSNTIWYFQSRKSKKIRNGVNIAGLKYVHTKIMWNTVNYYEIRIRKIRDNLRMNRLITQNYDPFKLIDLKPQQFSQNGELVIKQNNDFNERKKNNQIHSKKN